MRPTTNYAALYSFVIQNAVHRCSFVRVSSSNRREGQLEESPCAGGPRICLESVTEWNLYISAAIVA
jgi:hypothetical protein